MAIKAVSRLITGAADYEEGVWTPVLEGTTAAGVHTYLANDGLYTKIGSTVFAWFVLSIDIVGAGGDLASGNAQVAGLPFAARDNIPTDFVTFPGIFADFGKGDLDVSGGYYTPHLRVFQGTKAIRLRQSGDNQLWADIDVSSIANGAGFIGMVVYRSD